MDWSVPLEMAKDPTVPSRAADVPNARQVDDLYNAFLARLRAQRGLNVDAELEKLRRDVQQAFAVHYHRRAAIAGR